jgi:hypothetical protein
VILERDRGGFEEVLVTKDDMPVVGRKYHMACYGVFRQKDGVGTIDTH